MGRAAYALPHRAGHADGLPLMVVGWRRRPSERFLILMVCRLLVSRLFNPSPYYFSDRNGSPQSPGLEVRLTTAWSARMNDKVPSSYGVSVRGAHAER